MVKPLLTKQNVQLLQRTQVLLNEVEDRILALKEDGGYGTGRLKEACEFAETAIFRVLMIGHVYDLGKIEHRDLFPGKEK